MDKKCLNGIVTKTPGKVLIVGGYLIVSSKFRGLVLCSDTYFTCSSKVIENNEIYSNIRIKLHSMVLNQTFDYIISLNSDENNFSLSLKRIQGCQNKFIEFSLFNSFYMLFLDYNNIKLNILNRLNDYFSNKVIEITLETDYRFYSYDINCTNSNVKTGLGSSSALICSLSVNIFFLLSDIVDPNSLKETYLVNYPYSKIATSLMSCYYANNLASGKVGSGFDIHACLFGSQIFGRKSISESLINDVNIGEDNLYVTMTDEQYTIYSNILKDYEENFSKIKFVSFPKYLKPGIISIECGSDSRIMTAQVLKWAEKYKTESLFDNEIFTKINELNEYIISVFEELQSKNFEYDLLIKLKNANIELRKMIKLLSNITQVEIEPDILTQLMDKLMQTDVLFAICPGGKFNLILAGGFDAIFIYEDLNSSTNIEIILEEFNSTSETYSAHYIPINITDNGTSIKYFNK